MIIERDFDLTDLNTFGIPARAKYFAEINEERDIALVFQSQEFKENERLFLGGGSNVLFTRDFDGIVILNKLRGIELVKEEGEKVFVRAMGGEIWNALVEYAAERGYWGIENLSLIPGTVGAAPMQNIGAYGAELRNTLESVEAIALEDGKKRVFSKEECRLGYRDSIFKNEAKGKYFIYAVTLRLSKSAEPNISYRILKEYLESHGVIPDSPRKISEAVAAIRKSKLPDPKDVGNAGSFFKNVFVRKEKLEDLRKNEPDIPFFEEEDEIKIPAGWLIEKCGWKGKRVGRVGVHERQALVLVNHGGATGEEIRDLALEIIASVRERFGLTLIPEVNFI